MRRCAEACRGWAECVGYAFGNGACELVSGSLEELADAETQGRLQPSPGLDFYLLDLP